MLLRSPRIVAFASVLVLACVVSEAHADPTKTECIDAYTSGQQLKKKGDLREARAKLLVCSRDPCPTGLQADCNEWLSEVQRLQPSIVVTAHDETGRDRTDVRVLVDGVVVSERIDGRAIEIDPGTRKVRLELVDQVPRAPIEESLVVHEGQKARPLVVQFKRAAEPRQADPAPVDDRTNKGEGSSGTPWSAWLAGGVAVAALGVFAGFGIAGVSQRSDLLASCNNSCAPSDKESVDRKFLVADLALGVAVVATAATVIILLAQPSGKTASAR